MFNLKLEPKCILGRPCQGLSEYIIVPDNGISKEATKEF